MPTFIIILPVITILLEQHTAVLSVPPIGALALPLAITVHPTLTMVRTRTGASFQRAVLTVPTRDAQTRAVLALAVLVTSEGGAKGIVTNMEETIQGKL